MAIDPKEAFKTVKHAALIGLRFYGPMIPEDIYRYCLKMQTQESDIISNSLYYLGLTVVAAQIPAIYNQFRHFSSHLTAIPKDNACFKKLNTFFHSWPHAPGLRTMASYAYETATSCCKSNRNKLHHI